MVVLPAGRPSDPAPSPPAIFYSDANLGFLLHRFRRWIGVSYRLLFSNGGPCGPDVFARTDVVHQVAPYYHEQALRAGEPPEKHVMVPYGIRAPHAPPTRRRDRSDPRSGGRCASASGFRSIGGWS